MDKHIILHQKYNTVLTELQKVLPSTPAIRVIRSLELIADGVLDKFPHLEVEDAEEIASKMLEEVASRVKAGQTIGLLNYVGEEDVIITELGFEFIQSKI